MAVAPSTRIPRFANTADVLPIAEQLATIPGVVAVVLGGSRAAGTHRPDSDWDFGIYYDDAFNHRALLDLGFGKTKVPKEGLKSWLPGASSQNSTASKE